MENKIRGRTIERIVIHSTIGNKKEVINMPTRDYGSMEIFLNDTPIKSLFNLEFAGVTSCHSCDDIKDIKVLKENKVVEFTFWDGDVVKTVCDDEDNFSLETAISIAIAKHKVGGTKAYNKLIREGLRLFDKKTKEAEESKAEAERIAKRREKRLKYKERRAAKIREEQIQMQAEAYARALKMVEKE